MKYEHQINWANVYANNLDISTVGVLQNGLLYLISIRTSPLSERMANSEGCTSYDHKNLTTETSCTILAVCYASISSVSFKSTFVYFAIVLHMLALWQF